MPRESDVRAIETWLRSEDAPDNQRPVFDAEEQKQRDWFDLEVAARDFVRAYGGAAMLRCVSEALK